MENKSLKELLEEYTEELRKSQASFREWFDELHEKLDDVTERHWNECRQIAHYDDELKAIVRCKDCVRYNAGDCTELSKLTGDMDYCSFGERKSDKPKLTKAEHSFCEIIQEGYIARDASGDIYYCLSEPEKQCIAWEDYNWAPVLLSSCSFPFITWEDSEAWSIEDLLELKAEE